MHCFGKSIYKFMIYSLYSTLSTSLFHILGGMTCSSSIVCTGLGSLLNALKFGLKSLYCITGIFYRRKNPSKFSDQLILAKVTRR